MITNTQGNILIPKFNGNGHVTVEIYESEVAMLAHIASPTPATEPDRSGIYIGTKFEDAQKAITSLGGLTLSAKLEAVLEDVVIAALKENYRLLPRTKFDESDWLIKI